MPACSSFRQKQFTKKERSGTDYFSPIFYIMENRENTQVIILATRLLGKHIYSKPERRTAPQQNARIMPEEEFLEEGTLASSDLLETQAEPETQVEIQKGNGAEPLSPSPFFNPSPSEDDLQVEPEGPAAQNVQEPPENSAPAAEKAIKKGLFARKEKSPKQVKEPKQKKEKTKPEKKEKKKESRSVIKKDARDKAAMKKKFQSSEKVKKFSLFEEIEEKETEEDIIRKTLNADGYYDEIPPADEEKTVKQKKKRDTKKIAVFGGLVLACMILLALIIREIGGLF